MLRALSDATLALLQTFYSEQAEGVERLEKLKRESDARGADDDGGKRVRLSMADFREDWRASQFWVSVFPGSAERWQCAMCEAKRSNELMRSA
jgi:hypothetical protein